MELYINDNYDLPDISVSVELTSKFNNGASSLKFEYPKGDTKIYANGSTVRLIDNGETLFFGYLFETNCTKLTYKCLCYDQLVYLRAKNSFIYDDKPLSSLLNDIAFAYSDGLRVRLGDVEDTEINLKAKVVDNKSGLDVLYEAVQENRLLDGYWYALYDKNGAMALTDVVKMRLPIIIGDNSLGTDYNYTKSINSDTYNYVKSAKDDKTTGTRNIFVAEDSNNIGKWGKLVFYNKISSDLNEEQIVNITNTILMLKNRETQTLNIEAIGDNRVIGGSGVRVVISDLNIDFWAIVTAVTHKFIGNQHTMSLSLDWGES